MMNNQEREKYFYVRDYIQKPTLTAAQIKEKVKSILCESGVNGDIEESFSKPYNDIEMVLMDFNKSGWGYYERTLMNTLQDELNVWLLIEISKVNEEFFMNEKYADGFADFGGEIENEIMIDIFDGETYITIAEWKQMLVDAAKNKKYYAAENECIDTALAEFDSEQDRQDWLNYNTEYDKMYGIKPSEYSRRIPIDDESIIASFFANPLTTYCSDECIESMHWYIAC